MFNLSGVKFTRLAHHYILALWPYRCLFTCKSFQTFSRKCKRVSVNKLYPTLLSPNAVCRYVYCIVYMYRVGQKNGLFFRLDNFVVVSPRKACSMSKYSQFYRKKRYKTRISMSLNILCQICSNRHNSWNYGIYDQNTWILLNLH